MVINVFVRLQLLAFLSYLFSLSIREDILSLKLRIALLLNLGRVSLINFVTINSLGGFSWVFLGIKKKVLKRGRNMSISTLWRAQIGTFGIMIAKLCVMNTWSSITKVKFQNSFVLFLFPNHVSLISINPF